MESDRTPRKPLADRTYLGISRLKQGGFYKVAHRVISTSTREQFHVRAFTGALDEPANVVERLRRRPGTPGGE